MRTSLDMRLAVRELVLTSAIAAHYAKIGYESQGYFAYIERRGDKYVVFYWY
jgi:hypothetical protein